MSDALRFGFYFWLGAATTTIVVMGVYAATCMIRRGHLPDMDIPYWQGLLIYLPAEAISATVFMLTALITAAARIFPLVSPSSSGLVGAAAAGGLYVSVMAIILQRDNEDQEQNRREQQMAQEQNDDQYLNELAQVEEMVSRYDENILKDESHITLATEHKRRLLDRFADTIPGLVFLILPIILYCCLQLLLSSV